MRDTLDRVDEIRGNSDGVEMDTAPLAIRAQNSSAEGGGLWSSHERAPP